MGVEAANALRSVQRDEAELRPLRMVRRKQRLLANPGHVYSLLREERTLSNAAWDSDRLQVQWSAVWE